MTDDLRTLLLSIREPTPEMLTAAKRALREYIDALPADIRAKVDKKKHGYRVTPNLKHALRYQAMIDVLLAQTT